MIFDAWPRLENEVVILKKMIEADVLSLEQMLADKDIYRYEPTYLPEVLAQNCNDFITHDCEQIFQEKSGIILGIYPKETPDLFIGIAELYGYSPEREKISIGYRLKKDYWHRGIASSVVALLKDYIFNILQLKRITAHVRVENRASQKCLLHNGFVKRRASHGEDWGFEEMVLANKYVIYPAEISPEELLFFSQHPEIIPLYHTFLVKLHGSYPEINTMLQKTQITFANQHIFASIAFMKVKHESEFLKHNLILTLILPNPIDSIRIFAKKESSPGSWATQILLNDESQLDDELLGWIELAYQLAAD